MSNSTRSSPCSVGHILSLPHPLLSHWHLGVQRYLENNKTTSLRWHSTKNVDAKFKVQHKVGRESIWFISREG